MKDLYPQVVTNSVLWVIGAIVEPIRAFLTLNIPVSIIIIFAISCLIIYFYNTLVNHYARDVKKIVIHHHSLKTWNKIKDAKKEIILHAAYYPKYGSDSDYSIAFRHLMRNNSNVKITVIITDLNTPWANEFGTILRSEYTSINDFKVGLDASIKFFKDIQKQHANNVTIISTQRLPLQPIVIIDDVLLVGHYAHAEIPAPNGYWLYIKSSIVSKIIEKIRQAKDDTEFKKYCIDKLTDEEKAISRYIEDAFDSIKNGDIM